ncbi:MAG TPA: DUF4359 domain-containing protein [Oscillatoriaceae cyanobacterium M33_DOE_052]|uniref:DUF4359 domain-containing protein n=1 Tax=Planktothricoides sp. SpSt-374 TaxID=2282167 RepID=A0A7C3ZSE6_9CYAN|nr:DUF4359 domain-containing protein [Oscillatoriaceae cyanobacterium M33_DOE_052]
MKILKVVASVGAVVGLGVTAAMAITNPNPDAYQDYATKRLAEYIKAEGCQKVPLPQDNCASIVESAQPQLAEIIINSTQRQNFILFSTYKTKLTLRWMPFLPAYEFETVGAFQSFYTFKGEKL